MAYIAKRQFKDVYQGESRIYYKGESYSLQPHDIQRIDFNFDYVEDAKPKEAAKEKKKRNRRK
jgi:hypothetical protein